MQIDPKKVERLIVAKGNRLPDCAKRRRLFALIKLMRNGHNTPGFTLLQQRKIFNEQ